MRQNAEQNNSEYGHFLRSGYKRYFHKIDFIVQNFYSLIIFNNVFYQQKTEYN